MIELPQLFQAALCHWLADDARLDTIVTLPEQAQDYSGAVVQSYHVEYTSQERRGAIKLVTKPALIYERQILALLNDQNHANIPLSYSLDLHTPAPQLLCQQHAGTRVPLTNNHLATVAQALAAIHMRNRGAPYLPWMRRLTSRTFFRWWRPVWHRACLDADFVREFHAYLQPVERAARRGAGVLDRLWRQADCITVLHTDLSAWHVLIRNDQQYLIDWAQARYGPCYLDLVNMFTMETVPAYHHALVQAGFPLTYQAFIARFHAVWAFGGLKYMIPALLAWLAGEREQSRLELHTLLPRAIATRAPANPT